MLDEPKSAVAAQSQTRHGTAVPFFYFLFCLPLEMEMFIGSVHRWFTLLRPGKLQAEFDQQLKLQNDQVQGLPNLDSPTGSSTSAWKIPIWRWFTSHISFISISISMTNRCRDYPALLGKVRPTKWQPLEPRGCGEKSQRRNWLNQLGIKLASSIPGKIMAAWSGVHIIWPLFGNWVWWLNIFSCGIDDLNVPRMLQPVSEAWNGLIVSHQTTSHHPQPPRMPLLQNPPALSHSECCVFVLGCPKEICLRCWKNVKFAVTSLNLASDLAMFWCMMP